MSGRVYQRPRIYFDRNPNEFPRAIREDMQLSAGVFFCGLYVVVFRLNHFYHNIQACLATLSLFPCSMRAVPSWGHEDGKSWSTCHLGLVFFLVRSHPAGNLVRNRKLISVIFDDLQVQLVWFLIKEKIPLAAIWWNGQADNKTDSGIWSGLSKFISKGSGSSHP